MKNLLGSNQYKTKPRVTVGGSIAAVLFLVMISYSLVIIAQTAFDIATDWAKDTFRFVAEAPTTKHRIPPFMKLVYAEELATRSATPTPTPNIHYVPNAKEVAGTVQEKVFEAMSNEFGEQHWSAMNSLLSNEAGFSPCKINGGDINCHYQGEKACGIYQVMPCTKLLSQCPDLSDVDCQNDWGINYIKVRYGNPTNAWMHWLARVKIDGKDVGHWY